MLLFIIIQNAYRPQERIHLAKYISYSEDFFVYFEAQLKKSSGQLNDNINDLQSSTPTGLLSQRLLNYIFYKYNSDVENRT